MAMGRTTYELNREAIQKAYQARRLRKIMTRAPEKWVHDTKADSIEFTNATPKALIEELATRGYQRCAILGGTQVYSNFLAADLVDELWITIEPHIFGSGKKLASGNLDATFKLLSHENLSEQTLLLKYARA